MTNSSLTSMLKTTAAAFLLFTIASCRPDRNPTTVCGDIDVATTWSNSNPDGVDYIVDCVISVNDLLTIEPGTEIQFNSGAGLLIETGGSLKAVGSVSDKINMHGATDAAGSWKGIYIRSNNVVNEITHCIVSGGGQSSFDGATTLVANIRVNLGAKLKLTNSEISKSGKDGLRTDGLDSDEQNPISAFSNNTFSNNTNFPITTLAATVNSLDGTSSVYSGNGKQMIEVRGGRMFGNHIWNKCSVPYYINGYTIAGYYSDLGNLEVTAGVSIVFASDQGMGVGEYSNGYVRFIGTAAEPISLTGETSGQGAWKGVAFQSLNNQNKMQHVIISGGGSSSFTGATALKANISIGGFSAGVADISNVAVNNSGGYGILVRAGSTQPTGMTNVTYSNNALADYQVM